MAHRRTPLTNRTPVTIDALPEARADRARPTALLDRSSLPEALFPNHATSSLPGFESLAVRQPFALTRLSDAVRDTLPLAAPVRPIDRLPDRRFPVTSIDFSKPEVRLPFGVPQFVNAATLKAMAGGKAWDQLLKLVGNAWVFVADATRIDLNDASQKFRVGAVTVHS